MRNACFPLCGKALHTNYFFATHTITWSLSPLSQSSDLLSSDTEVWKREWVCQAKVRSQNYTERPLKSNLASRFQTILLKLHTILLPNTGPCHRHSKCRPICSGETCKGLELLSLSVPMRRAGRVTFAADRAQCGGRPCSTGPYQCGTCLT